MEATLEDLRFPNPPSEGEAARRHQVNSTTLGRRLWLKTKGVEQHYESKH